MDMRRFGIHMLLVCVTGSALLVSCSRLTAVDSQGPGTEVIGGVIFPSDSNHVQGVVYLRKADTYADTAGGDAGLWQTVTDSSGGFLFDNIRSGSYIVEVLDTAHTPRRLAAALRFEVSGIPDRLVLGNGILTDAGSVSGTVVSRTPYLWVQIAGLQSLAKADSAGRFVMRDIPAGSYTVRLVSSAAALTAKEIAGVRVASGSSTDVGNVDFVPLGRWNFHKSLYFNTTSAGAAVPGDVSGFPVLIRLTNGNFNFGQAKANGNDLRFTKSDGSPLAFEIERWDAAGGSAEIWVKTDTVYGNDSAHFITMYWGAQDSGGFSVVSASNGAAVFDTGNGFQAVWHMGEAADSASADATENRYNGAKSDSLPSSADGDVGLCRQFDGANFIRMPNTASGKLNFPAHGAYAVSAWVYADSLDTNYAKIIEKNDFQYKLQVDDAMRWSFTEYESGQGFEITNAPATARTWVYLVGVRSGGAQYLFVNGALATLPLQILQNSVDRDTTSDVTIGRAAVTPPKPPFFFRGRIDEVRLQSRELNADWIRLCYMNQKSNDALVIFAK